MLFRFAELFFSTFISGYLFVHFYVRWALTKEYLVGNHFYYRSLVAGFPFWGLAFLSLPFLYWLIAKIPPIEAINSFYSQHYGAAWAEGRDFFITVSWSALISFCAAKSLSKLLEARRPHWYRKTIRKHGTELQRVLLNCHEYNRKDKSMTLVEISCDTGKSYIGFPLGTSLPDPRHDKDYVTLWPFFSGYRDEKNQRLKIITNYVATQDDFKPDLAVTIDVKNIVHARLFNPELYNKFQAQESDTASKVI